MQCEVCGAEEARVHEVTMEGSTLKACPACKNLGDEPSKPTPDRKRRPGKSGSRSRTGSIYDDIENLVDDYPARIRESRERMGMTQKELASKVGEKRSLIKRLESGDKIPEDDVVESLERVLGVELIGESGDVEFEPSTEPGGLTLGDVASIKRWDG